MYTHTHTHTNTHTNTHTHTQTPQVLHTKPHAFHAPPFYAPRSHALLHHSNHRLRWNGNAGSRHQDQQPPLSRPSSFPASVPPSNGESRFIVEAAVPLDVGALALQEQHPLEPGHQYQQGVHPPPLETVSSTPYLQVVAAPLPNYSFATKSQNMPSLPPYPYPTTSTKYYSEAHGAQPFSYKDTVETAGQDSAREAADFSARVEDARRRGLLQAAKSLVQLLNVSPGYVYPL